MRIALLHTALDTLGGAERFAVRMSEYLDADLITTNIDPRVLSGLGDPPIRIRSIGSVPRRGPWRQEGFKRRFSRLRLSGYDAYVIAGDWAVWAAHNHYPNVWYCHSPIRELWDLRDYTRNERIAAPMRPVFDIWSGMNRMANLRHVRSVDRIIANSQNTQSRIARYLNRESTVVYPPIMLKTLPEPRAGSYWLSVNRLVPHKRIALQLEAFARLPEERLIVLAHGSAPELEETFENVPPNVRIIREQISDEELGDLYAGSKGTIATSRDEDFGLSVIEGFAYGKPAIAVNEGGFRESVTKQTGILVPPSPDSIADAVRKLSPTLDAFHDACIERAHLFSVEAVGTRIRHELADACAIHRSRS